MGKILIYEHFNVQVSIIPLTPLLKTFFKNLTPDIAEPISERIVVTKAIAINKLSTATDSKIS